MTYNYSSMLKPHSDNTEIEFETDSEGNWWEAKGNVRIHTYVSVILTSASMHVGPFHWVGNKENDIIESEGKNQWYAKQIWMGTFFLNGQ